MNRRPTRSIAAGAAPALPSARRWGAGPPRASGRIAALSPPILLPEQLGPRAAWPGELRLMSAVLEEAIRCFQTCLLAPDKQRKKLFCEAERWLMEDDTGALVSFPEVCELLGLDTGYIRRGLRRWQAARRCGPSAR